MAYDSKPHYKYGDLQVILQKNLPGNSIWFIKFLVLFITSVIKLGSIVLTEVGKSMDNKAKKLSNVRMIQRYLYNYNWSKSSISKLLKALVPIGDSYVLIIDKTSWKFGSIEFNIMMLAVEYEGIAMPLYWILLDKDASDKGKDGASTQEERIRLLEGFKELFGFEGIKYLLADREFIGAKWFSYLKKNNLNFYIRIKENAVLMRNGKKIKVKDLFNHLGLNTPCFLMTTRLIYEHDLYLSAMLFINDKNKAEYIIVASLEYSQKALAFYKQRWQIETMFKALKSNGFNLEKTHIESIQAFDKLLYMIALAFIWAYLNGIYQHKINPIKTLKHGYKAISIFKLGFEHIQQYLLRNIGDFYAMTQRLKTVV